MSKYIKIGKAADILGVTVQTLRRWERIGTLMPDKKTEGNTRYYLLEKLIGKSATQKDLTIAYARVSSHDQKKDLKTQADLLASYCLRQGWSFEVIQDLGSGMNYHKKGLKRLIGLILQGKIQRLVLTHKDRLLRFGAELIFSLCEANHIEVVLINQGEDLSFEEELAQDVLEIITVFSARMYGARSKKNLKLLETAKELLL
jgi:predicted site-specific integrase-resolvase